MKKILALCFALFSIVIVVAQPPNVPADKGAKFGVDVSVENAVTVEEVVKSLKVEPKAVKIKGEVVEVCKAEGCWLRMKNGEGTIMVRMKDHKFFVPVIMKGKTIVVQGAAQIKETSVAQLKHYAEDAGKSKEEIDKIKDPKKEVVLNADGIVVM